MNKKILLAVIILVGMLFFMYLKMTSSPANNAKEGASINKKEADYIMANKKTIYLAGGCFWGMEGYFQRINGVIDTDVGYANGKTKDTNYQTVSQTDHAETLKLDYDISKISLEEILLHYFRVIDPTSVNKQGNDIGRQYRTGIYFEDKNDKPIIDKIMAFETKKHGKLAVEVQKLTEFILAEDYHQDYLDKNPNGYCHINLNMSNEPLIDGKYLVPSKEELKKRVDELSYDVMVNAATERPFSSPLDKEYRKGIYVDKATKEPLFASKDKFDGGCGWPSFSKPILTDKVKENQDTSHGMIRTEVRAQNSNSHLGHVFTDGPKDKGGLRYCINGASLEFIPYEEMDEKGYSEYKVFVE
ncbi:peptide-methionine (R)-S-oxide reductase MsrB [Criibacterium bergeronii]|nr:peptide-methionine (R)-S-oxide reductase MsrB [Criibacterium bergeronii]